MSVLHNHPSNVNTTTCPACLETFALRAEWDERGFTDEQVCGFDTFLAALVARGVRELATIAHGFPTEFVYDDDPQGDQGMKDWKVVLAKIAHGMDCYVECRRTGLADPPEFAEAQTLLMKYWGDLWD